VWADAEPARPEADSSPTKVKNAGRMPARQRKDDSQPMSSVCGGDGRDECQDRGQDARATTESAAEKGGGFSVAGDGN
jgi:hypothetical protein